MPAAFPSAPQNEEPVPPSSKKRERDLHRNQLLFLLNAIFGSRARLADSWKHHPRQIDRLRQCIVCLVAIMRQFAGRRSLELVGPGVKYLAGPVVLRPARSIRKRLTDLLRGGLFIEFSENPEAVLDFCRRLELDPWPILELSISNNSTAKALGTVNGNEVHVHLAVGQVGRETIRRHRTGLQAAHDTLPPSLRDRMPREIGPRRHEDVFIQSQLPGFPVSQLSTAPTKTLERLRAASIPIQMLHRCEAPRRLSPEDVFDHEAMSALFQLLPPATADIARQALAFACSWISQRSFTGVAVHGDYCTNNVLCDAQERLTGVVDWEWFQACGLPGYDAIHLLLTTITRNQRILLAKALRQAWVPEERSDEFTLYWNELAEMCALREEDLAPLGVVFWLAVLRRTLMTRTQSIGPWLADFVEPTAGLVVQLTSRAQAEPRSLNVF